MKRIGWLLLLALVLAACGGNAATPTSAVSVDTGNLDLSGLSFEVHQEPG